MSEEIKEGDVVCLKSDGTHVMTVETIDGKTACCVWIHKESSTRRDGTFSLKTLTPIKPQQEFCA